MRYCITCLSEGMKSCMVKPVNYKVWSYRGKRWKPGSIPELGNRDFQEGHQYRPRVHRREDILAMHFTTQTTPDIKRKLQAWGWASTVNLGRGGSQGSSNQDITEEAHKDKRLMGKTQLLAVLTHPPPKGTLEGQEDWTDQQGATWAGASVPFVRKRGSGRGNVLSSHWCDDWGATVTSPNSCEFLRREILHTNCWGPSTCMAPDPAWSIPSTCAELRVTLSAAGRRTEFLVDTILT